jgi:hypothetical protein
VAQRPPAAGLACQPGAAFESSPPRRRGCDGGLPPHLDQQQKQWVLMELYWQFPQVRWTLATEHGPKSFWFLAAPGTVSPGHAVWQEGGWTLGRGEKSP